MTDPDRYDWDALDRPRPLPTAERVDEPTTPGQWVAIVAVFASLLCVPLSVVLLGLGVVDWVGALAIFLAAPLGLFCTTVAGAVIYSLGKART